MRWSSRWSDAVGIALRSLPLVVLGAPAFAQATIYVPGEQPTIQAGIDAAQDGDTVLVAPGTYVETIDFLGKAIAVQSTQGPEVTTIDGAGQGSVVTMVSGESEGTVLRGFTITGGTESLFGSSQPKVVGGGVIVVVPVKPGPLIADCVITQNEAADRGGGVFMYYGSLVENCVISENVAAEGGGLYLFVVGPIGGVRDCRILGNRATADGGGAYGCGPFERCVFSANLATGNGGGLFSKSPANVPHCVFRENVAAGNGGGIAMWAMPRFEDPVELVGNRAGGSGGGIWAERIQTFGFSISAEAIGLRLIDNAANGDGGGMMLLASDAVIEPLGAIKLSLRLESAVITGNIAAGDGGAIYAEMTNGGTSPPGMHRLDIVGSTIADNTALVGAALHIVTTAGSRLDDSIVWGNSTPVFNADVPAAQFSIVQGGIPGTGMLDVDPLFIHADADDYGLRGGSPAIDSADPSAPVDADGSPADRGAVPFAPWIVDGPGVGGAYGVPMLTATGLNSPNATTQILVRGAPPASRGVLVVGNGKIAVPFKGGVFVPEPDFLVWPLTTDADGNWSLAEHWVPTLPSDYQTWQQVWFQDETAPQGWAATNGLKSTTR